MLFVTHDIDESVYLSDRIVVLSHAPTVVKEIVDVDLPVDRDQIATKELPEFAHLRTHVYRLIKREPGGSHDEKATGTGRWPNHEVGRGGRMQRIASWALAGEAEARARTRPLPGSPLPFCLPAWLPPHYGAEARECDFDGDRHPDFDTRPLDIGIKQGFFAAQGIEVKKVALQSGNDIVLALANSKADRLRGLGARVDRPHTGNPDHGRRDERGRRHGGGRQLAEHHGQRL